MGMCMDWSLVLALVAAASFASVLGILALWMFPPRLIRSRPSIFSETEPNTVFLFDGDQLIDSTPSARALLQANPIADGAWHRLMAFLSARFADVEARLSQLPLVGVVELVPINPKSSVILQAEHAGGLTRITLVDTLADGAETRSDPLSHRAMAEELELLRETVAAAPLLLWREDASSQVTWANAAYLTYVIAAMEEGKGLGWPLPRLFGTVDAGAREQRQSLAMPGQPVLWFDIQSQPEGDGLLLFATPADAAVHAETALRDFMQTLTKTFAQLPIGLAIFDRQRRLQLFNPALLDLTHLPADFLSMRPSMLSVLDAMRDRKMLPEPKDYRDWRRQIVDMEKAAASGLYEETWSLPDGQTYRVIGRPHPNGALALMIEDISSEMLRTRRYRADLELSQSVIDEVDEAIAVFSQSGQLVMSNNTYAALWGHDPAESLADSTMRSLSSHWRAHSAPTAIWAEVEDYAATIGDRERWQGEVRLLDGRLVSCRFAPLVGGATLASFRPLPPSEAGQPRLAESATLRRA